MQYWAAATAICRVTATLDIEKVLASFNILLTPRAILNYYGCQTM